MSEIDPFLFRQRVLERYHFPYGNGKAALTNVQPSEVELQFVNTLVRAFEEEPGFRISEFRNFPLEIILDYISKTHALYLNKTLQEMEQSISNLGKAYDAGHPLLEYLNDFFIHYKTDLIRHIREEDEKLLPHVAFLDRCNREGLELTEFFKRTSQFSTIDFLEHHHDNEIELKDIRNHILTYEPPSYDRSMYRVLLNQLEFFSHDLRIHGLIEEQILVPLALEWEQKLFKDFFVRINLN